MTMKHLPNQEVKIDISGIENLKCPGCGGEIFIPCAYIKVVSRIQSPTGGEVVVNVQDWMCDECGTPLNKIMGDRKKDH